MADGTGAGKGASYESAGLSAGEWSTSRTARAVSLEVRVMIHRYIATVLPIYVEDVHVTSRKVPFFNTKF